MANYKVKAEIVRILEKGTCPVDHKIGDVFRYPEDLGKLCPVAGHALYTYFRVLQNGGTLQGNDYMEACCPDAANPVVFRVTREE